MTWNDNHMITCIPDPPSILPNKNVLCLHQFQWCLHHKGLTFSRFNMNSFILLLTKITTVTFTRISTKEIHTNGICFQTRSNVHDNYSPQRWYNNLIFRNMLYVYKHKAELRIQENYLLYYLWFFWNNVLS